MSDRKKVAMWLRQALEKEDCLIELPYNVVNAAYELLKAQEPRVLTLEEFENHWKIHPQQRQPIWEEWKIDEGKGRWKLYGRATRGYGTLWRCWTARPTDEQRKATPWE